MGQQWSCQTTRAWGTFEFETVSSMPSHGSTLEPMDDELFIDGTACISSLESLTLNATSETLVNLRKRTSVQGRQLP